MRPITYQEFVASEEARLEEWRRRFRTNEAFADGGAQRKATCGLVRADAKRGSSSPSSRRTSTACTSAPASPPIVWSRSTATRRARIVSIAARRWRCRKYARRSKRRARRRVANAAGWSRRRSSPSASAFPTTRWSERASLRPPPISSWSSDRRCRCSRRRSLPLVAKRAGAALAIINREATPLDAYANISLHRSIGAVFSTLYPQLVD